MRLEFHGAAGGVTGSHLILDTGDFRIGVDAGLFRGGETERNIPGFGYDPRSLRALLLTHAHIDHSGRIPLLVKEGFRGPIYSTSATADLCDLLLRDSARLMEEAFDESRRTEPEQPHAQPRPPLYTREDVVHAMRLFQPVSYGEAFDIGGVSVTLRDAGHILGSSLLELDLGGRKLVFSGDLGRPGAPILRDPERVSEADWLVLESTYGDRDHGNLASRGKRLLEIVLETVERGGNVIIPASAVGRTQEILFELNQYAETGRLEGMKCFVDSPLAISVGEIYSRHPECFDEETTAMLKRGDDPLKFLGVQLTRSRDESKAINELKEPHIVISGSGTASGGRVLYHLENNLERPECTVLLVGFQPEGTLGRLLQGGAKTVQVMDKQLEVRARIETLHAFSAHAGRKEILEWLRAFKKFPRQIFLNHGEPSSAGTLAKAIRREFGAEVITAKTGESYQLG
ncbi:MAG TPA: MBL fold metallo-hydrolase [Methanotrichaceae archaeon]|nr:MBL fold metallo-hydrolase [Methanotrichaceae archaeon]